MEIRILRNIKQGPYVEFNTTGKNWDDSSLFLAEEVFSIFSDCFDRSHAKFNYYGPTWFRRSNLEILRRELRGFASRLDTISNLESFDQAISTLPMGTYFLGEMQLEKIDWESRWLEIVDSLKNILLTLTELVENCLEHHRDLWVHGI